MNNDTASTKATVQAKGYSPDYKAIRSEVESKWPAWKVSTYNANFATSTHATKLPTK